MSKEMTKKQQAYYRDGYAHAEFKFKAAAEFAWKKVLQLEREIEELRTEIRHLRRMG